MGPEDWMPNLNPNNMPPWLKAAIIGGSVAAGAKEIYDQYQGQKQNLQLFKEQSTQSLNNKTGTQNSPVIIQQSGQIDMTKKSIIIKKQQ